MQGMRYRKILSLGLAIALSAVFLFVRQKPPISTDLVAQNTYFGPTTKGPGNKELVRIQVLINDDPAPAGAQIESAEFNGQNIPLKPRDIYGYRGQGSFQVYPGTYKLKWVVKRDRVAWPRTLSHEEIVTVDPRDLWLQLTITGEKATIQ